MNIFISYKFEEDLPFFRKLQDALIQMDGIGAYDKDVYYFFKPRPWSFYDPLELDEYLRDEDLALVILSESYLADPWLPGELHALLTLDQNLRPNFVVPVFKDIDDQKILPHLRKREHVDFRGRPFEEGFAELAALVDKYSRRPSLPIFISHSSKDAEIARALTKLLRSALNLPAGDILCTSLSGHRLELGTVTSDELRKEIRRAQVFLCIATANSIGTAERSGSFYVLIELGARWATKRYLAVLLAAGAQPSLLKAPLNNLNVLDCKDRGQAWQIVTNVGKVLGKKLGDPASYEDEITSLIEVCGEARADT